MNASAAASALNVEDILITPQLWRRRPDDLDPQSLDKARRKIASCLNATERDLLQALVEATVELCPAHTAGFSVLYKNEAGEDYFRWDAMAGELKRAVGGTTPRDWSPCGTTLDRQSPQLFSYPGRYFSYFNAVKPAIVEGLVLPVYLDNSKPFGTLWIVSHDERLKFDAADAQIMNSLAHFCSAAISMIRSRAA